jgi:hypothetical protein
LLEEQGTEQCQIGEINEAIPVEIRIGISSEEHATEQSQIGEINEPALIQIAITHVPVTVIVGIPLAVATRIWD